MSKDLVYKSIYFLISLFLCFVVLRGIEGGEFLFVHDEFLILSKREISNLFASRNPVDFGISNAVDLIVLFFDRIFYLITYKLNLSFLVIQKISYLLRFGLILFVPFAGFRKLSRLYLKEEDLDISFIVSLFYSINLYTLIFWNTGGASITFLVCYVLAPAALYFYHNSVFAGKNLRDKIFFISLLFLMSFSIPHFAVFLIFLALYTFLLIPLEEHAVKDVIKSIGSIILLYFPFSATYVYLFYEVFAGSAGGIGSEGGNTYGLIKGGFLYQLLMWFSWGIYTSWRHKSIFTFSKYLRSIPALLSPFILYILIIVGAVRKKRNVYTLVFVIAFLVSLFFAKGSQFPLGGVYTYLIENVSVFSVFRSPDTKFGFSAVLSLAVLLLIVSREFGKKMFVGGVLAVVLIQGFPLYSGAAIRGENTRHAPDRIIRLTRDYAGLANFINSNDSRQGYVLTFPSSRFDYFDLGGEDAHLGQDILPKIIDMPFVYLSEHSGMASTTRDMLKRGVEGEDFDTLKQFPIKYFVVRHDIKGVEPDLEAVGYIEDSFPLVYENERFKVFENNESPKLIGDGDISFKALSSTKYLLDLDGSEFVFLQSFNREWKLYLPGEDNILSDTLYIFRKPLFEEKHRIYSGYANLWNVSPEEIEGSNVVLIHVLQSALYLSLFVSFGYLLAINIISNIRR